MAGPEVGPVGDVVNLNGYRKARKRDAEARQAEVNRVKFGRDKATKKREKAEVRRLTDDLDGKKVE